MNVLRTSLLVFAAVFFAGCACSDNPRCRRVAAAEFMAPHLIKGIAMDRFIGVAKRLKPTPGQDDRRAYKEIWEIGLFHSMAILWIPAKELPVEYLANAHKQPNRPAR